MAENNFLKKMDDLAQSISADPFTLKKAVLLCFYADGVWFAAEFLFNKLGIYNSLIPDILYLAAVLLAAHGMGRNELRRIFIWRKIPFAVFISILFMFNGFSIIESELIYQIELVFPIPEGFFDGWFYEPKNKFLLFLSSSLFPGFTEEIFYRGILTRRFNKAYSPRRAILLSAAMFGIAHLNLWQAASAFSVGIFWGWIYLRSLVSKINPPPTIQTPNYPAPPTWVLGADLCRTTVHKAESVGKASS